MILACYKVADRCVHNTATLVYDYKTVASSLWDLIDTLTDDSYYKPELPNFNPCDGNHWLNGMIARGISDTSPFSIWKVVNLSGTVLHIYYFISCIDRFGKYGPPREVCYPVYTTVHQLTAPAIVASENTWRGHVTEAATSFNLLGGIGAYHSDATGTRLACTTTGFMAFQYMLDGNIESEYMSLDEYSQIQQFLVPFSVANMNSMDAMLVSRGDVESWLDYYDHQCTYITNIPELASTILGSHIYEYETDDWDRLLIHGKIFDMRYLTSQVEQTHIDPYVRESLVDSTHVPFRYDLGAIPSCISGVWLYQMGAMILEQGLVRFVLSVNQHEADGFIWDLMRTRQVSELCTMQPMFGLVVTGIRSMLKYHNFKTVTFTLLDAHIVIHLIKSNTPGDIGEIYYYSLVTHVLTLTDTVLTNEHDAIPSNY